MYRFDLRLCFLLLAVAGVTTAAAGVHTGSSPRVHSGAQPQDQPQPAAGGDEPETVFLPHWYLKLQAGGGADVGEAKFSQLLTPSLQLGLGYQLTEYFGLRGDVSGLWARNRYAYPEAEYKWSFVQPTVNAVVNLTSLFLGSLPEGRTHAYAFLGAGAAYSWGNGDAVRASRRYGVNFEKLWDGSRWHAVVRGGLGIDYAVSDRVAIGAEVNANMLPDHFNSKRGRSDNKDWHFNALVGLKFTLGRSYARKAPVRLETPAPVRAATTTTPDTVFVDVPIDKVSFNVNIFFIINRSDIRANQMQKLSRLIAYLDKHPKAFVRLSGYADRDTGNPTINMRLSRERAAAVSQYLQDAGIQEWRIRRFAKGDRVQPFDKPENNRVCICYVYDPEHPERIDNWY